ncbi:hypothetical protein ACFQWF_16490 [Methylorubrum suomiense]
MMVTADQALESIRPDLASVIAAQERNLGSRMLAYESLGSKIGRSPTWIRKVLGRAEDVTVGLHDAFNIRTAYERLCARVEHAADALEAGNEELRRNSMRLLAAIGRVLRALGARIGLKGQLRSVRERRPFRHLSRRLLHRFASVRSPRVI